MDKQPTKSNLTPEQEDRAAKILVRWLNHEITDEQADRELLVCGIDLPESITKANKKAQEESKPSN